MNIRLAIIGIFSLSILGSSCSQNQTYNRGYVISQTQLDNESDTTPTVERSE
jgi:hypothetical protein